MSNSFADWWNSGFGFDCDNAGHIGGQIGGATLGSTAAGATAALATAEMTTPATWIEAVPTVAAIGGAYETGQHYGQEFGKDFGQGACDTTNHFLDWLTAPAAPTETPTVSPELGQASSPTATAWDFHSVFSDVPSYSESSSSHGGYDDSSSGHSDSGNGSPSSGGGGGGGDL